MRGFFSRFLIVLGLCLILGAGGLAGYNMYDSNRAEKESAVILAALSLEIPDLGESGTQAAPAAEVLPGTEEVAVNLPLYELYPEMDMPAKVINGYRYIAVIEIPSIGVTLPVMEEWDYSRLKVAPCRYAGSAYTHDLVIAAHNYRAHFSKIKWMGVGEEVILTDMDNNVFRYEVIDTEVLSPSDVVGMTGAAAVSETEGDDPRASADGSTETGEKIDRDWDLTLFTCTTGGKTRFALRCALIRE